MDRSASLARVVAVCYCCSCGSLVGGYWLAERLEFAIAIGWRGTRSRR